MVVSRHVPATSRPSLRTSRGRAPLADAYGFRPLVPELRLLSVYEFVRYWEVLPVAAPGYDGDGFSEWTVLGRKEAASGAFQDGKKKCQAGLHYVVKEPTEVDYLTYPDAPENIYKVFRNLWVLRRRPRRHC